MPDDTQAMIATRETTHGDYQINARIAQEIKYAMRDSAGWDRLDPAMKESLHLIATKIGRILSGNPNVLDHWDDIAGYAKLVSNTLPQAPAA